MIRVGTDDRGNPIWKAPENIEPKEEKEETKPQEQKAKLIKLEKPKKKK
jgi:hypothetical protein